MKNKICRLFSFIILHSAFMLSAFAQSTAFTYQGRLNDGANPANGSYDLTFALFDAGSTGTQLAGTATNPATAVSNGLFTVTLDFGNQFPGANRWVEIAVRTNGGGAFSTLAPRQAITAAPYALQAANATTAGSASSVAAANLSGTLLNSSLPASPTFSGTATASGFAGSGAAVTALNAGNIASGTVSDARLSSNVALRNADQTFTGANTMNNPANNFSGTFNGNFSGSGAALTNVNLMSAIPAYAISLTTNSVGAFGFTLASAPLVGNGPHQVVAADVNGDGKMDVVTANPYGNSLTVLTNNGSGVFVPATSLTAGSTPWAVTAADVNNDGKMDLISANYNGDNLSVLTNNGSGGFVLASSPSVGDGPRSVVAADVNGDAKVDLISANYLTNTLSVLTNRGNGLFALAASPVVAGYPAAVTAADVNGDTTIDLISANSWSNTVSILLGTGTGSFVLHSSPAVGTNATGVALADINGDGKVDLISANDYSGTLSVLTNNGGGTFGSNATLSLGGYSVTAAEVNGDGKVDLISPQNFNSGFLRVWTNNGTGKFNLATAPAIGSLPYSVAAADVNGDGTTDLISANEGDSTVSVLLNTLTATTTTATLEGNFTGSTLSINGTLTAGTFNGNGGSLTNLAASSLTGTIPDARLSANVPLLSAGKLSDAVLSANVAGGVSAANAATNLNMASTIVKRDASGSFSAGAITATNFTGNGLGLTNLNASNLASGMVPDARLSPNVALNIGSETFAGNLTIGGFPIITRTTLAPTNTATISPTSGYVKFIAISPVSLNATTAIANGPTIGAVLILEGVSDTGTVTVPDGANTRLGSNLDRVLGLGDTLTLLWNGVDWVELSYVNN